MWKNELTEEARALEIDKMTAFFRSLPKHSHIDPGTIREHCKKFEAEKVFARATSLQDYHDRIQRKMKRVKEDKASQPSIASKTACKDSVEKKNASSCTPSSIASSTSTSAATTVRTSTPSIDWQLDSMKLKTLSKISVLKKDTNPARYSRVFSETNQSWANSILLNTPKHATKSGRLLTPSEQEGRISIIPHIISTKQMPSRPAVLIDISINKTEKTQRALMIGVYSDGKCTSSNYPIVFDLDSFSAFDRSVAVLSKFNILSSPHVLNVHPHLASMLYQINATFNDVDLRKFARSGADIPSSYDYVSILVLPRIDVAIESEFALAFSKKPSELSTITQLDHEYSDHVKSYRSSMPNLDNRNNFYACLRSFVQASFNLYKSHTTLTSKIIEAIVSCKEARKAAAALPSSASDARGPTKYVCVDSDGDDETPIHTAVIPKKGSKRASCDDVEYSDYESDSACLDVSDVSDDYESKVVVKRQRTSVNPDESLDKKLEELKKKKKEANKDKKVGDEDRNDDDNDDNDDNDDDDESSSEEDDNSEEEEEDEDEEDEEVEEVPILVDSDQTDVVRDTNVYKAPKLSQGKIQAKGQVQQTIAPSRIVDTKPKLPLTPHERRLQEAIRLADVNLSKGFDFCMNKLKSSGYGSFEDEVRDHIIKNLQSKATTEGISLPRDLNPNSFSTQSTTQSRLDVSQAPPESYLSKIPTAFDKQLDVLRSETVKNAFNIIENGTEAKDKSLASLAGSRAHLTGLSEGSKDAQKDFAIRALFSSVKQCTSMVHILSKHIQKLEPNSHGASTAQELKIAVLNDSPQIQVPTGCVEELIECNSNLILGIVPPLATIQTQLSTASRQFESFMKVLDTHKDQLTRVIELCNNAKQEKDDQNG